MVRNVQGVLENDPILRNSLDFYDLEREEGMELGFKKLQHLRSKKLPMPIDFKSVGIYNNIMDGGVSILQLCFSSSLNLFLDRLFPASHHV